MGPLWQDIRYGFRMLVRNPGFTAVVVLVLGLGIAANTAIFNAVDQVLLRPLPVERPHELVMLEYRSVDEDDGESHTGGTFNYPLYESYRDESGVFAMVNGVRSVDQKLQEVKPGVFTTKGGGTLDFTREVPTWCNYRLEKR